MCVSKHNIVYRVVLSDDFIKKSLWMWLRVWGRAADLLFNRLHKRQHASRSLASALSDVRKPFYLDHLKSTMGLHSTMVLLADKLIDGRQYRVDPDFRPLRTSIRTYHSLPSSWQRTQEKKRRAILLSLGTSTGFLPCLHAPSRHTRPAGKTPRPPVATGAPADTPAQAAARALWRDELRDRLIATPTAARRDLRQRIAAHNRSCPPSRTHIIAAHREGLRTAAPAVPGEATRCSAAVEAVPVLPVQQVSPEDIGTSTVMDPTACAASLLCALSDALLQMLPAAGALQNAMHQWQGHHELVMLAPWGSLRPSLALHAQGQFKKMMVWCPAKARGWHSAQL